MVGQKCLARRRDAQSRVSRVEIPRPGDANAVRRNDFLLRVKQAGRESGQPFHAK